jgi:hypothetical protein
MLGRNFPFFNSLGGFYPRGNGFPQYSRMPSIAREAPNFVLHCFFAANHFSAFISSGPKLLMDVFCLSSCKLLGLHDANAALT